MHPTYQQTIEKHLPGFPLVTLTPEKELQIATFIKKASDQHLKQHNLDKHTHLKPWITMKMILSGEGALEQFLGVDIINYTLNKYGQYEPKGLNDGMVRIKVFPAGKFPIIYQQNTSDLLFVMQKDTRNFYICGFATKLMLNSYHSSTLVPLDEPKRERKACFYGFDELRSFTDKRVLKAVFG